MTCPKMALYRWVLKLEEEQPFMAGFLGTAGHACIFEMHQQKRYDWSQIELLEIFEVSFNEEVEKAVNLPKVAEKYDTIQDQFDALAPWYVGLVMGYQEQSANTEFMSTVHEQLFVLEVEVDGVKYIFTGQIDQAGYYQDGVFALRDIKFRDNAWSTYFSNPRYLELIEDKFGKQQRQNVESMAKIKLKRKILGD